MIPRTRETCGTMRHIPVLESCQHVCMPKVREAHHTTRNIPSAYQWLGETWLRRRVFKMGRCLISRKFGRELSRHIKYCEQGEVWLVAGKSESRWDCLITKYLLAISTLVVVTVLQTPKVTIREYLDICRTHSKRCAPPFVNQIKSYWRQMGNEEEDERSGQPLLGRAECLF